MTDNTKVVLALLAGLAAGAAIGLLFAPEKGEDTRDSISESLTNLGNSIKDSVAVEIDKLAGFKDKTVETIKSKFGADDTATTSAEQA